MKKGDWIQEPDGDIWQLDGDAEPGSYVMDECILWKPISGSDYVMIRTGEIEGFRVALYDEKLHSDLTCEPYLGPLPTWLVKN